MISTRSLIPYISMAVGFMTLLILTLQYPWQTTFPIGGDHTRYARQAEQVLAKPTLLFNNSFYPATVAILAAGRSLPGEWPTHLTWWVVLAHLSAGVALAALAFRLSGPYGSALAFFVWGLTVTGPTGHIEDATLAQLMSHTPLLLSFLAWGDKKITGALILLALTFLFHPFGGFIGATAIGGSLPLIIAIKKSSPRRLPWWLRLGTVAAIIIVILTISRFNFLDIELPAHSSEIFLPDLLKSRLGPFIIIAPLGLAMLVRRIRTQSWLVALVATFSVCSILFAFNDYLNVMLFARRFMSYFMMAIALLASLALPPLLSATRLPRYSIASIVTCVGLAMTLQAWASNAYVFDFYETPHKYARLHEDERAAIDWLAQNVAADSLIVSTTENRHSEWIPLLSQRDWHGISNFSKVEQEAPAATHLVVFRHREKPPAELGWPVVFENKGVLIFRRPL